MTKIEMTKLVWLVQQFKKHRELKLSEISEHWKANEDSHGEDLPRTTFNRWRDAILHEFGIIIECDRRTAKYYISNEKSVKMPSVKRWLYQQYRMKKSLLENIALHDRILLENISTNNDVMDMLMEAMNKNLRVAFTYKRYDDDMTRSHVASPYFVITYERRVYFYGKHDTDCLYSYALDRVVSMELTNEHFSMEPGFDAKTYMKDCYGMFKANNVPPERIVIKAYDTEHGYLKDLPLHSSQKWIGKKDDYHLFELFLSPTNDFIAKIMSRKGRLVVEEPKWLADEIRKSHRKAAEII